MICANPECSNQAVKKYCSQSCSAKITNINRARPKGNCLYCSTKLVANALKYCNVSCQQLHNQAKLTELWLTTGQGAVSASPTHYMRVHIFAEQSGKCALCAISNKWNGIELRFILDHIDGNAENSHRDNLRLVCPNCDSQLDTYKSKNKGKGRHSRRLRYANGQSY